jgi:hypothetical protein
MLAALPRTADWILHAQEARTRNFRMRWKENLKYPSSCCIVVVVANAKETNYLETMLSPRLYISFLLSMGLFRFSVGFHLLLPSFHQSNCNKYSSVSSTTSLFEVEGDPLREATGIQPSLHPTTINAIAEALKFRATKKEGMAFRVSDTVQPLEVAATGLEIAKSAISKRQKYSEEDGMTLTTKEEQTVAGRVLGVIMRLDDLEDGLHEKVSKVGWIAKYNEWASFGTLETENDESVDERIKDDPLFCVSRAECLLALFLKTVEAPALEKANETVPDGSKIDFLDEDRLDVI